MELVVYIDNEQDLVILEPLLKRLKLRFEHKGDSEKAVSDTSQKAIEALEKLDTAKKTLARMRQTGVDISPYGDPIEWQKTVRKDKALPYED